MEAAEILDIRGLTGDRTGGETITKSDVPTTNSSPESVKSIKTKSPNPAPSIDNEKENLSVQDPIPQQHQPLMSPGFRRTPVGVQDVTILPVQPPPMENSPIMSEEKEKEYEFMDQDDEEPLKQGFQHQQMMYPTQSPYSQLSANSALSVFNAGSNTLSQEDISKIMAQTSIPTCPVCSKDYANFPNLRSHLQTHLNGKPFACEFCDAKFSRASHLCRHR